MTSPVLDHLEGSCACPRVQRVAMTMRSSDRVEQRVAMTSHLLDHLEGSCACSRDQRVAMTMRSPDRVEGSLTDPLDQRVAMTSHLQYCIRQSRG